MAYPLELVGIDDFRATSEVNVIGQLALTQLLIPLLRRAEGRIVFIGSVGDRMTVPFAEPLTSSKSAVASLNDTLRQELAPWGIEVILVEPGSIHTPAVEAMAASVERTVTGFTPEQSGLYEAAFTSVLGKFLQQEADGSPPDIVAKTTVTALQVKNPSAHDLTGSGAHKLAALA